MSEVTGSQLTIKQLLREGIDTIYVLQGDPIGNLCSDAVKMGMRVIAVRHEQTATMAASAHSYLTRKCGVAMVASGPAHTNALTGLANAWSNCWPVLLIAGSGENRRRHMGEFQEAPQVESSEPFCKLSYMVENAGRIPVLINTAIRKAMSGRPGPVYLDYPADIITNTVEENEVHFPEEYGTPPRPQADPVLVKEALDILQKAKRPLMIVGKGAAFSGAENELREFAKRTNIPYLTTPMGSGTVDPEEPTNVASARTQALKGADTILLVGARLNWILHFGLPPRFASDYKLIQVDIEPEELGTNHSATVGLAGDAKAVIGQMNAALDEHPVQYDPESDWLMSLTEIAAKNAESIAPMLNSDEKPMGYYRILKEVQDYLPKDAFLIADGASTMDISRQVVQTYQARHRMDAGVYGNVGVGIPFAMAAQLLNPDKKVLILQGDWALGFNGMDLETLARNKLPIVLVVFQNGNPEKWHRTNVDKVDDPGQFVPSLRYDVVMQGLGGQGETVDDPKDLKEALDRAFASDGPYLINALMDPGAGRRKQEYGWLDRTGVMMY